ncbi:RISC-loading complex subunit tarbp2-like isoform X2 [Stegodyphus dumicola]|uniref:RISC-loading complex subunit tarbp2-like isoform X2 n=1 Tax=Stegodyphus dumicola TaxID=202533 RepID=UPI0015A9A425|nr:RISC-loading complex subunit tarbp2-like isoform X2 [Stegodyphus dumicola]
MTNAAQKTPISLLQELCAQQGMTPDYKLMSVEGAVHAPTFMYRVQVNEVVATATGQSKKKAKHAAAKAVLERLLSKDGEYPQGFLSDGVTVNAENLTEIISEPAAVPAAEENVEGNPVGALQELCMKRKWQPPYYETEKATGLPHEKVFSIMCVVDNHTTSGEGKSKRLAKRQAADNMLKRLKALKVVSDEEEEAAKGSKRGEDDDEHNSSVVDDKDSESTVAEQNSSLIGVKDSESTITDKSSALTIHSGSGDLNTKENSCGGGGGDDAGIVKCPEVVPDDI